MSPRSTVLVQYAQYGLPERLYIVEIDHGSGGELCEFLVSDKRQEDKRVGSCLGGLDPAVLSRVSPNWAMFAGLQITVAQLNRVVDYRMA